MKKCKFEELIDEYLMNRLDLDQKNKFEEHYFNCRICFTKLQAREELAAIIKANGDSIFMDDPVVRETGPRFWWTRLFTRFTPTRLALGAVSAAMILLLVLTFFPGKEPAVPEFRLDNPDLTRGRAITLIPSDHPAQLSWESLGNDIEYRLTIFEKAPIWEIKTKDNQITIPESVRANLLPGNKYYWQVKAYSQIGTLIARSEMTALETEFNK